MKAFLFTFFFLFHLLSALFLSAQQFDWTRYDSSSFAFAPTFEHQSIARDNDGGVNVSWLKQFVLSYNSRLYGTYELNSFDSIGNRTVNHLLGPKVSIASLKVLSNGDFVISGTFMDTMTVDGSALFTVNSPGQFIYNSYLVCFDGNGSLKWTRNLSATHSSMIESCLLAEDPNGDLWISMNDYPNGGLLVCMSGSGTDSIVRNWPAELSVISDMEFDAHGNLYLSGALGQDNFDFWSLNVATGFTYNAFLAKVDPVGDCRWFRSFQDITFDKPHIALDDRSDVYLVKDLFDSVTVYGNHVGGPQWVYDFLVVKFDSSGNVDWALDVPDQATITGDLRLSLSDPIAVTADGFNLLLGNRGYVDLASGFIVGSGAPASARGMVLVHFDTSGVPQWHLEAPSTYGIYPQQVVGGNTGGFLAAIGSGPLQIGNDSISMPSNFTYYPFLTRFSAPISTGLIPLSVKPEYHPFINPSWDGDLVIQLPSGKHRILFYGLSGKKLHDSEVFSAGDFTRLETSLKAGIYLVSIDDGLPFKWIVFR